MDFAQLNWPAVIAGTIAAFVLGMLWFGPRMFGKVWVRGSHNIQPPDSPPVMAMALTLIGLFVLALIVGMTETNEAIGTAIGAIGAVTLLIAGMDLFSQKSGAATLVDSGYILASGVLMIAAQGIL